ncbi:MAG: serine hydrolase [Ignavibacteriae bacterium]|nr:serine hydrolase [Ignavibacteriota bacterium]NOH00076.1 serine hydrolase [Ignavibacteriota bacterium]
MFKKTFAIIILQAAVILFTGCEQKPDVQATLEKRVENFKGDVGIFVKDLKSGETFEINADTLFPTASMIKVPIMIKIFDRIEKGELSKDSTLLYFKDTINYQWKGDDAISRFREGEDISISKLLTHMITFSDNHASLWLQKLAGTGTAINEWLEIAGLKHTRVNSRTKGREAGYKKYGWGQTTPKEMAELLIRIRNGEAVSENASEDMYRHLTRIHWDEEALSQIPPTVQAASKQGAVSRSKSEVVLVNAPHGDYVFCVITKNQEDTRWEDDNEGYVLIRDVSKILWDYFEPDYTWKKN